MGLTDDLKAIDRYFHEQNTARRERISGAAVAERPAVPVASSGFVPPLPWMRSAPDGRFCVRYRFSVDDYAYTHRASSPADLGRFMRDMFTGGAVDVLKVWEDIA